MFGPPPQPAFGPPVRHDRRGWFLVLGAIVVAAGIILGAIALTGGFAPDEFTLRGNITITDDDTFAPGILSDGATCQGTGGYSDLSPGTAVIVADPTGRVVATGALANGVDLGAGSCMLPFSVPGVPGGLASYSVTVSHRGTQVVGPGEAHSGVLLSIGSN
jgi:hypothetical protein